VLADLVIVEIVVVFLLVQCHVPHGAALRRVRNQLLTP
jgi:hypothetical protein